VPAIENRLLLAQAPQIAPRGRELSLPSVPSRPSFVSSAGLSKGLFSLPLTGAKMFHILAVFRRNPTAKFSALIGLLAGSVGSQTWLPSSKIPFVGEGVVFPKLFPAGSPCRRHVRDDKSNQFALICVPWDGAPPSVPHLLWNRKFDSVARVHRWLPMCAIVPPALSHLANKVALDAWSR
jgi:hypothetical protein